MAKAIIFDWGGVFMRTEDYTPRHTWDSRLNKPLGTVESVVHGIREWRSAQLGEISTSQYWKAVQKELGLSEDETLQLTRDFYSGDQLDKSLVDLVKTYRSEGIPVGLLSNNIPELHEDLEELNLRELFSTIVISSDIGIMKPAPDAYQAILDKLGLLPEHCVFIDDSVDNIRGAETFGIRGIHFKPDIHLNGIIREWLNE